MFGILQQFNHKSQMRESKDEILTGELVRAMARRGCPAIRFRAHDDRQELRFLCPDDPVLYSVFVVLDRMTGSSALTSMVLGSKATLRITAEVKNRLSDPDDVLKMYKTDLQNMFKMPALGGIKLNHELNSVFATKQQIIEIDNYVMKGDAGLDKLIALLDGNIQALKDKLIAFKK